MTKSSASIRMDLARGHVALGEHVEALACLERAVRESPDVPGLLELIDELLDIWSQERERVACRAAAEALREYMLGRSYRSGAPSLAVTPAPMPAAGAQLQRVAAPPEADPVAAFDAGHAEFRSLSGRAADARAVDGAADAELELDFEVPPEESSRAADDADDLELADAEPVDDVLLAGFPPVLRPPSVSVPADAPSAEDDEELTFATPIPAAPTAAFAQERAEEDAEPELDLEAELDAVLRRRPQAAQALAMARAALAQSEDEDEDESQEPPAAAAPQPIRTDAQRAADARVRELERWLVNLQARRAEREGAQA